MGLKLNPFTGNFDFAGGSETYTNANPSLVEAGGIPVGTTFSSVSYPDFMDMLLYPELFGTLTAPSSTFTSDITGYREIGEVIATINFGATFSRGSITPQYYSASPYRSGLPNTYVYTGTDLTNTSTTNLTDSKSISSYTVISGAQSWTGRVAYDAGVHPKGSNGTDFDSPLSAGNTSIVTRTITGVYPIFATTVAIATLTKQSLQANASVITKTFIAEDGVDKQRLETPQVWGASLSKLEQYNTLSATWDEISTSTFTRSSTTETVQGSSINYYLWTHNGSTIGSRQLRFTF